MKTPEQYRWKDAPHGYTSEEGDGFGRVPSAAPARVRPSRSAHHAPARHAPLRAAAGRGRAADLRRMVLLAGLAFGVLVVLVK